MKRDKPNISKRLLFSSLGLLALAGAPGCQDYEYVFQPDVDREGAHLRFTVQQPSRADLLFVIDNSRSMREEQEALKASIGQMLDLLAPRDTSYRIGIISTDAFGFDAYDCLPDPGSPGPIPLGPNDIRGSRGPCDLCAEAGDPLPIPACTVGLRRPHDGARGRLIAAYDSSVFRSDATDAFGNALYDIDPVLVPTLDSAFPTGINTGPVGYAGVQGARWVIDRRAIRSDACEACGCAVCSDDEDAADTCFEDCAKPIAKALVTGYFNANVNGLGIKGWGYEEGIRNALWAVGINGQDILDEERALTGFEDILLPGGANSFRTLDDQENLQDEAWVRDDALLAVMFVSDEEDGSLLGHLSDDPLRVQQIETQLGLPAGGLPYGSDQTGFLGTPFMARLLERLKGTRSRVAVGVIGGLENGGEAARRQAGATDCVGTDISSADQPSTACSCVTGAAPGSEAAWCALTDDTSGDGPTCDALAGDRYVNFANEFQRKTFDSICRTGQSCETVDGEQVCEQAFGPALEDFALIATLACFELNEVRPADCNPERPASCDPSLIRVLRTPRELVPLGEDPLELQMMAPDAVEVPPEGAWYYDPLENKVCLIGIDCLLGDVYDVFVLHTNVVDFTR